MNAVATIERAPPKSVLVSMADRFGMEPQAFEATVRATVCKGNVSREEFAAFLLVAKEHRLNPLTKEIFAFPAKGGGIQPIVSIDGWARIINEHPQFDGMEFIDTREGAELVAITCRMYRKDRTRPIEATEYMAECRRQTDVWKQWPARMLRHKAMIQAARYSFGFSGIVEMDEYERQVEHAAPARRLAPGFQPQAQVETVAEVEDLLPGDGVPDFDATTGEVTEPQTDDFPGDRQEATAPPPADDAEDPETWAREIIDNAEAFEAVSEIDALFADPLAGALFTRLQAENPTIARQLEATLKSRQKALADRERAAKEGGAQ